MKRKEFKFDFLCVGFNKSGTTTLENLFKKNSDICLPKNKKEILFFAWYDKCDKPMEVLQKKYYPEYENYNCIGSIEPSYCKRAKDVYKYFGKDVKLIFMMRNPITATLSLFKMRLRHVYDKYFINLYKKYNNDISLMFNSYIDEYIVTKKNSDFFYDEHINEFLKYYPKEQMKFIIMEEFLKDPNKYMQDIFSFLGVKNIEYKNSEIKRSNKGDKICKNYYNAKINFRLSKIYNNERRKAGNKERSRLCRFLAKMRTYTLKNCEYKLTDEEENKLSQIYAKSIKNLEKITNKDLKKLWFK